MDIVHKGLISLKDIGRKGENLACGFLKKQGFAIIGRNYLRPWGELDVIAQKGNDLRFVEVKTVSRESSGRPEDNVHPEKLRKLGNTIQAYMAAHPRVEDWRFDVITVKLDLTSKKASIGHLKDIIIGA